MSKGDDLTRVIELLEVVKHKVDNIETVQQIAAEKARTIDDKLSVVNRKLDANAASLVDIEAKLDSYADSYKENQRNIERLDTRLNTAEEELAIDVPENLKVPHFAE